MSDSERTIIGSSSKAFPDLVDRRVHYLEVIDGIENGRRYMIESAIVIGRVPPADLVLADSEVSRNHCKATVRGEFLIVEDLGSTNGTFVDGVRVTGPTQAAVGAVLRIGRQSLKYESRGERELAVTAELDRDLEQANSYVQSLLPAAVREGPVRCEWVYQPSAKLGGDAFGYFQLEDGLFVGYLIDVSGHGAGAAMHAVSILNVLSRSALPGADMRNPNQVLTALNAMFPMDSSGGMYFTMWYGVYDAATRKLDYATAGHHAAYLRSADTGALIPLGTKNPVIGVMDRSSFNAASHVVAPGSSLFVFSDGVFEVTTRDGAQWDLPDFLPLIQQPSLLGFSEPQRLLQAVQDVKQPGGFEDDFSMVVLQFV